MNIRAFGVAISVGGEDPALEEAIQPILPPGQEPAGADEVETRFSLDRESGTEERFRAVQDGQPLAADVDLADALDALDGGIRLFIASHAPDLVFVHAGVVAAGGRGLILPGATRTGKTELVAALVNAGATYYSDEFAVLDADGLVHPYARPLARRSLDGSRAAVTAEQLGGTTGTVPAPVAVVAATSFDPAASWQPSSKSRAAGALLLLAHAGQARRHPNRVLRALLRATEDAAVVQGPRGEARAAADALLNLLANTSV